MRECGLKDDTTIIIIKISNHSNAWLWIECNRILFKQQYHENIIIHHSCREKQHTQCLHWSIWNYYFGFRCSYAFISLESKKKNKIKIMLLCCWIIYSVGQCSWVLLSRIRTFRTLFICGIMVFFSQIFVFSYKNRNEKLRKTFCAADICIVKMSFLWHPLI